MQKTVLVIGGAGYIGSHMVKCLLEANCQVVVLDDLSAGFRDSLLGGSLVVGDCGDREVLDRVFTEYRFDGVLHFASLLRQPRSLRRGFREAAIIFARRGST